MMKEFLISKLFSFLFIALFMSVLSSAYVYGAESAPVFERKIVVFQDSIASSAQVNIIVGSGAIYIKTLQSASATVVFLDAYAYQELLEHPMVVRIEDDVVVEALTHRDRKDNTKKKINIRQVQQLPWGVDMIDAEWVWPFPGSTGAGVKVGVIDTGISVSHPDLASNIKGGMSSVNYTDSWDDDNGHGSHVAGIIGAQDNTFGVVGVSHEASLYAIKTLDRRGSGYLSDFILGIDWAREHNMGVVNMSLGCDCDSVLLHDAILRTYNSGIVMVAAAGNNGGAVMYPAAYSEVIAVTATDSTNIIPYWASRGPEVDFVAPGVRVYSTYKKTAYKSLSGTSMASPHVAGSVALLLTKSLDTSYDENDVCISIYDVNCNDAWDPAEVKHRLQDSAIDLGVSGHDDIYGAGLINAFLAFFL